MEKRKVKRARYHIPEGETGGCVSLHIDECILKSCNWIDELGSA